MQTNNEPVTIKVNNKSFDIFADGTIHQEMSSSGVELDEVRLQAAPTYLAESRSRGLSRTLHAYWQGVSMKTDVRNFANNDKQKGH